MSHTLGAFNYIEFRLYSCLMVLVVVFLQSVLSKNFNIIEKIEVLKRYNWACKQNCESLSRSCLFCNSLLVLVNEREAFYMDVFPYKNTFWNWQAPITSETKFNITTATQKIRNERNEEENSMYDNKKNQRRIKFYCNAA